VIDGQPSACTDFAGHVLSKQGTADVVVLTCTLNDTSHHLADARFLQAMRRRAVLINVARGGLMEYGAVREVSPIRTQFATHRLKSMLHLRLRRLRAATWVAWARMWRGLSRGIRRRLWQSTPAAS
jgi:hypothetical protein